jgi:hypothetical protein
MSDIGFEVLLRLDASMRILFGKTLEQSEGLKGIEHERALLLYQ